MTDKQDEYEARRLLEKKRKRKAKAQHKPVYNAARQTKIWGKACRLCGTYAQIEAHHIVPRSRFGMRDASQHTIDNLMPLCHTCHQNHHTTTNRVPRSELWPDEVAFIAQRMTPHWIDHWYPLPEPKE